MTYDTRIAIFTLISNFQGIGPGHSALWLYGTIYTFEELAGPMGTSWLLIDAKRYLEKNVHRPVLVQELNELVDHRRVARYLMNSMQSDADYIGSGVCSTQVAYAIEAGMNQPFDCQGIDTPAAVFTLAKNKGIVKQTYYWWPEEDSPVPLHRSPGALLDAAARMRLRDHLRQNYPKVPAATPDMIARLTTSSLPAPRPAPSMEKIVPVVPRKTTLSKLAMEHYRSLDLWPLIWDANRPVIGDNPNRLRGVKELRVNPLSTYTPAQIADAKKRAPTWRNYPL
jgi:hypothetical protein